MYLGGIDVNIGNLYPKVDYPVSRNVPALHNLLTWDNVKGELISSFMKNKKEVTFLVFLF